MTPCGRVWSTSMSVALERGTSTGIASASVASSSRMPRKLTGPPASHGSRPDARSAQQISSWLRRSARSTIAARSASVAVQCSSIPLARMSSKRSGRSRVHTWLITWSMSKAGPPRSARSDAHEARIAEPELVERGQVGGLAGEQEGRVERAGRGAVHLVERVAQPELLDRRGHPRRHDARAFRRPRSPARPGGRRSARPGGSPPRAGAGASAPPGASAGLPSPPRRAGTDRGRSEVAARRG